MIRCKCGWAKSGLGAEVRDPRQDCEVHGFDGPMPMFTQVDRQAGMLKSKHDGPEKARGIGPDETATTHDRIMWRESLWPPPPTDDRHAFSSGAISSGMKPKYAEIFQRLTMLLLERTTAQRRYGDNKYGINNWMKGARDKEFILDRINHGIEHLLTLAREVEAGDSGNWEPGKDDAAAVVCCAMFVMQWQYERDDRGPGYGHGV